MTEQRIDATAPPKIVWLLDQHGMPTPISGETHVGDGRIIPLQHAQGRVILLPQTAEEGWTVMEQECSPEAWAAWTKLNDDQRKPGGHGKFLMTRETMKIMPARMQEFYRHHPLWGEHVETAEPAAKPKRATSPVLERI